MRAIRSVLMRVVPAMFAAVSLVSCANVHPPSSVQEPRAGGAQVQALSAPSPAPNAGLTIRDEHGTAVLEKVPFRAGTSTVTVERLARQAGCQPRSGAGLLTDTGPIEIYRLQCEDGRHFIAQCELRQCRALRR